MFVLTVKALQPVSIQLVVDGQSIELTQQPPFYSSVDVLMIGLSAFVAGTCLTYLTFERRTEAKDGAAGADLASVVGEVRDGEERRLLELVVEAGGSMYQSDLVDRSGFSKGKVSLILDRLEARGLVRRERSGMTNLVTIITKS